jgi:hypothetical protein
MILTMTAEWIKFRSVFANWVLVALGIAFPIVVAVLVGSFSEIGVDSFGQGSIDLTDVITGTSVVTVFLLGSAATISLTAEFAHGTIRPTYAATPNRLRVLLAKLAVNSIIIAVTTAVAVTLAWVVGAVILSSRDRSISFTDVPEIRSAVLSVVALAVIVGWFGVGVGLVIRNQPAALVTVVLWPLLIEGLVALALALSGADGAVEWLPYSAALTALQVFPPEEALGRPGAFIYFGGVSLAIVAVGWFLDNRRDA